VWVWGARGGEEAGLVALVDLPWLFTHTYILMSDVLTSARWAHIYASIRTLGVVVATYSSVYKNAILACIRTLGVVVATYSSMLVVVASYCSVLVVCKGAARCRRRALHMRTHV
jgi:hypothetical protein